MKDKIKELEQKINALENQISDLQERFDNILIEYNTKRIESICHLKME